MTTEERVKHALAPVEEILEDLAFDKQVENLVTHHSLDDPNEARKASLRAAIMGFYKNHNSSGRTQ